MTRSGSNLLWREGRGLLLGAAVVLGLAANFPSAHAADQPAPPKPAAGIDRIGHIVVIYLENHSFDNLFGRFPGADGLANADGKSLQVDKEGKVYALLPPVINTDLKPPAVDDRFPMDLPNKPFAIDKYVPIDQITGDMWHRWYQEQLQIDGGKMDKFVAYSDAASLVMGNYDISKTSIWRYARAYTLSDNYYHGAFGGSFLNHMWLICGCAPRYPDAPAAITAQVDAEGHLVKDGSVTPDGYAVNTIYSVFTPHPKKVADATLLLPPLDNPTVGDQLSAAHVSWAWYSGGWNDALAGNPDELFQFHHQPFAYFKNYGNGTEARAQHLRDEKDLLAGIKKGVLPSVVFWKPIGAENQHPGYAELIKGDRKVDLVIKGIQRSKLWKNTVILITYDENGGSWDHVAPPIMDKWGPGTRVPLIVIAPFAKKHYVDHSYYDTTSILKLIHERYHLAPLTDREARVGDFTGAMKF